MRTLIKNALIVNENNTFKGSVLIDGETISGIFSDDSLPELSFDKLIEAEGLYLLPGIIDDHVHFREPGLTHKADIKSESRAAAAGGVTSFMDMPNVQPQTVTLEALEEKFRLGAENSSVNYSFYFGATNENTPLLNQLDIHRVCGIKLFMGSSTGNMLVDRLSTLRLLFEKAKILIATHCEDQHIIRQNTESYRIQYGEDPDIIFHPCIRNGEACFSSSSVAIQLARETGARLHILHVSTGRELSLFEDRPLKDKKITSEACIAHLLYSDQDYTRLGSRIKCNPAIKSMQDRNALRTALQSNRIDVIGTDHAPHLLNEKAGGSLKAVSGMPMIQFSLVSMMELVKEGILSIEQLVNKMCHAPADLFEIDKRGYIRKGYQADLVLVHPDYKWQVTPEIILSKCGWSPLEGHAFTSKVIKTWVNGHLVYQEGKIDGAYRGQELQFRI